MRTLGIVGALVAVLGLVVAVVWMVGVNWAPETAAPARETEQAAPRPVGLESNVLLTGNVYWGRYINDWSRASELGVAYPFSRLHEFGRDDYQAWIGGLECPTAAGVHLTSAQEEANLSFNCSPDYLPEAAKWYTAFTLANNHTDNQGVEGFRETQQHLEANGIQYFGHYDPRVLEDVCEIISIDTVVTLDNETTRTAKLPLAMCAYHGVFRVPTEEAVAQISQYAEYMPVIAMPHMGAEYKPGPDQIKTDLYRSMIDHGADMVIGDHPHWVQSTEAYKGKPIVYSMGNFIFDQQFNREVTRSAAIKLRVTAKGDAESLEAWTELAAACERYKDECLDKARTSGLKKLDYEYGYAAIGTSNQQRLAHPANEAESRDIMQRLGWEQTMQSLQAPHSRL